MKTSLSPTTAPAPVQTLNASTLPKLLDPTLHHLRDVTLIAARSPGRSIRAHRFILASASPVLRASLLTDPGASALTLSHADADALDAALQYVYGRSEAIIQLPTHALWPTLSTCIAYTISAPMEAVQERIIDSINVHNVFYHWGMAEKYHLDMIELHCRNVVKGQFADVAQQPEFLDVGAQRLARVLRIHDLTVKDEDQVFMALERWLAFDVDDRAEQALQLLRLVRLPTMSDLKLLRVCRSPYFGGHNEFYQLLLEALIRRTEVRVVHAPRVKAAVQRKKRESGRDVDDLSHEDLDSVYRSSHSHVRVRDEQISLTTKVTDDGDVEGDADAENKADASVAKKINRKTTKTILSSTSISDTTMTQFKPLGISDEQLLQAHPPKQAANASAESKRGVARNGGSGGAQLFDYNRREDRTVLFEGMFPLRWYKSVRFRPRSRSAMVFSVVIPKWSRCRRRFISESRSFLNHKWSVWVDPYSAHGGDDAGDYISIYLCCESELQATQTVDARVDFALFVGSSVDEHGMERKVCVGRTFKSHGQAMGFRRHTKRSRLTQQMYVCAERDELVIGAHIVASGCAEEGGGDGEGQVMRSKLMGWVGSSTVEGGRRDSVSDNEVSGWQQGQGMRVSMEDAAGDDEAGMGTAGMGTRGQRGSSRTTTTAKEVLMADNTRAISESIKE